MSEYLEFHEVAAQTPMMDGLGWMVNEDGQPVASTALTALATPARSSFTRVATWPTGATTAAASIA